MYQYNVHVPAEWHKGPDALFRWLLAEGEVIEPDDDSWLNNIVLYLVAKQQHHNFQIPRPLAVQTYSV